MRRAPPNFLQMGMSSPERPPWPHGQAGGQATHCPGPGFQQTPASKQRRGNLNPHGPFCHFSVPPSTRRGNSSDLPQRCLALPAAGKTAQGSSVRTGWNQVTLLHPWPSPTFHGSPGPPRSLLWIRSPWGSQQQVGPSCTGGTGRRSRGAAAPGSGSSAPAAQAAGQTEQNFRLCWRLLPLLRGISSWLGTSAILPAPGEWEGGRGKAPAAQRHAVVLPVPRLGTGRRHKKTDQSPGALSPHLGQPGTHSQGSGGKGEGEGSKKGRNQPRRAQSH